jgi:hypothetical protein
MSASVNISSLIEIAVFMLDSITKGITVCQWDFYFSLRFVDRAVVSAGPRDKLFLN